MPSNNKQQTRDTSAKGLKQVRKKILTSCRKHNYTYIPSSVSRAYRVLCLRALKQLRGYSVMIQTDTITCNLLLSIVNLIQ